VPFAYSCFVSYSHGQHDLMKAFMGDLKQALQSSLEPYSRLPLYIDDRLQPGYHYNEALALALCRSVAMVVVYTPRWAESDYCQRELHGMLKLEQRRRRLAEGAMPREYGLIVPVLLRGRREQIPNDIRNNMHYCDFSRYTTAEGRIGTNSGYIQQIEQIASYIYELQEALAPFAERACATCSKFRLPPAAFAAAGAPSQPFPGRAA
jgi:hypothetical protein